MKTRATIFDAHISTAANILNAAVKVDKEHHIPERYINYFCELVANLINVQVIRIIVYFYIVSHSDLNHDAKMC